MGEHPAPMLPRLAYPCAGLLPMQQIMFQVKANRNLLPVFTLTSINPVNFLSAQRNWRTQMSAFTSLPSSRLSVLSSSFPTLPCFSKDIFSQLCELLKTEGWQSLTSYQLHTVEGSRNKNRSQ